MNSINIESKDIKTFMNCLLIKDTFDSFLLEEASITTYNTFNIDGHIQKDFFSPEELSELPDETLSTWATVKPFCFSIIKGNKLPLKFKIVLKAAPSYTQKLLNECQCGLSLNNVGGLYMNIRYDSRHSLTGESVSSPVLDCVSMASLNIFTMDKTLEKAWDEKCRKSLLALTKNEC